MNAKGPILQFSPIFEPFVIYVEGYMIVSLPIITSNSTVVVEGSRNVTPLSNDICFLFSLS